MTNDTKQAILKIGTDAYQKGIETTFDTVIFAINESAGQMVDWTPEMYIAFIKEVQKAVSTGTEKTIKKHGQR